eukprot:GHVQ01035575.1.p1 GENE.GHVQ01035575.1~~GHVQ01035575.1.p1  ORF type:complete len:340 (-),score=33.04 GHVQ01035575.1:656-1675(-)
MGDEITQLQRRIAELEGEMTRLAASEHSPSSGHNEPFFGARGGMMVAGEDAQKSEVKSGPTAPVTGEPRYSADDRDVIKLKKRLGVETFDPKSERGMEETLLELEDSARGLGVSHDQLAAVLVYVAPRPIRNKLSLSMAGNKPYQEFIDDFALRMFEFSRDYEDVAEELRRPERKPTVLEAEFWVTTHRDLYERMAKRHKQYSEMTQEQLKRSFLAACPAHIEGVILSQRGWREYAFGTMVQEAKRLEIDRGKAPLVVARIDRAPVVAPVSYGPVQTEEEWVAERMKAVWPPGKLRERRPRPATESTACFCCGEMGHYKRDCGERREPCAVCGRRGHGK